MLVLVLLRLLLVRLEGAERLNLGKRLNLGEGVHVVDGGFLKNLKLWRVGDDEMRGNEPGKKLWGRAGWEDEQVESGRWKVDLRVER